MDGFVANLFEFWGGFYLGDFSNDMYQNGYYLPIFFIILIISFFSVILFYYGINHPRYNRWWHWLLHNVCTGVIISIFTALYSSDAIIGYYAENGMESPYSWTNYFTLSLISFFWSLIIFFIFSFMFKWWSINCKHSPFI